MARHPTLAAGFARLLAGPLVSRPLLMGGLASLAGNLALLRAIHRGESAILFSHTDLLDSTPRWLPPRLVRRTPRFPAAVCRLTGSSRSEGRSVQRMCHGSRGGEA